MRLPHFEYYIPESIEDACKFLRDHSGEAFPLAGGTDLFVKMKQRRIVPKYLINLKKIPDLDYIKYNENDGLRLGALTTIQSIKNSIIIKRYYKLLSEAAGIESSVQIRNIATIGGNIANASPAADAPLALIVLGANLILFSLEGERKIYIGDFFLGPGKTVLRPGEIIREIHIPPLPRDIGSSYIKHATRRTDIAIASVAVYLKLVDNICKDIRIGLGSVAPTPFRAKEAEGVLLNKEITEEMADKSAQAAVNESRPIDDIRGYADYRAKTIRIITKQAILEAVKDARLGGI